MSAKHLTAGSSEVPFTNKDLRLYSMVFCPYSQRVRMVLAAKKIDHEVVNIHTANKPEWYKKVNPLEQVPTLQHSDGRILAESGIIIQYLDDLSEENKLTPTDPYKRAYQRYLASGFSKIESTLPKLMRNNTEEIRKELSDHLVTYENNLNDDFFGGSKPALLDYIMFPWFHRFEIFNFELDQTRFPKLIKWVERMKNDEAAKSTILKREIYDEFFKGYLSGNPNPDIGITGA